MSLGQGRHDQQLLRSLVSWWVRGVRSQKRLRIVITVITASPVTAPAYGHATHSLPVSLYGFLSLSFLYLLTNFLSIFHLKQRERELDWPPWWLLPMLVRVLMPACSTGCPLTYAISSLGLGDDPTPASLPTLKQTAGFLSRELWEGFWESGFVANTPEDSDVDCVGELLAVV